MQLEKLGVPPQTLDSKITSLEIDKRRFEGLPGPSDTVLTNFLLQSRKTLIRLLICRIDLFEHRSFHPHPVSASLRSSSFDLPNLRES